jgi:hypothetical protein
MASQTVPAGLFFFDQTRKPAFCTIELAVQLGRSYVATG